MLYFNVAKIIISKIQDLQTHYDGVIISTVINVRRSGERRGRRRKGRVISNLGHHDYFLPTPITSRTLGNS